MRSLPLARYQPSLPTRAPLRARRIPLDEKTRFCERGARSEERGASGKIDDEECVIFVTSFCFLRDFLFFFYFVCAGAFLSFRGPITTTKRRDDERTNERTNALGGGGYLSGGNFKR